MPHGFFTVEQWKPPKRGGKSQWVAVGHFDGGASLAQAIEQIEGAGKPGFFRIVQTQRMIWAEKVNGKLKLRRWHANSPQTLARSAAAYDRDRWPGTKTKRR